MSPPFSVVAPALCVKPPSKSTVPVVRSTTLLFVKTGPKLVMPVATLFRNVPLLTNVFGPPAPLG
jgi:hypothetical protein